MPCLDGRTFISTSAEVLFSVEGNDMVHNMLAGQQMRQSERKTGPPLYLESLLLCSL